MTKSRHSSHSADTDAAKREAMRTGRSVEDIMNEWLDHAKTLEIRSVRTNSGKH